MRFPLATKAVFFAFFNSSCVLFGSVFTLLFVLWLLASSSASLSLSEAISLFFAEKSFTYNYQYVLIISIVAYLSINNLPALLII